MTSEAKIVDSSAVLLYDSRFYEKAFKNQGIVYDEIKPAEGPFIAANAPWPLTLTYKFPNHGQLITARSYLKFKASISLSSFGINAAGAGD